MTWKGQHHVLRAIALLRDRGRDVHGLIVGGDAHGFEPEYEPALHRLARELDIEDRVTFTGQVPNGARYMQLMDVVLNASDAEPFGIVVLEGMALRVPVVAVDNAGPAEIIEHGVSGLLVPAATPEHFAHACERLVDSPEERVRLAEGGRARYLEHFTRVRMVDELTGALEELGTRAGQARAA
jgi:glycosyltransferase involved in cell wall biosynthesis